MTLRKILKDNVKVVLAVLLTAVVAGAAPAIAHGVEHALFAHNADKLDGKNSGYFAEAKQEPWHVVGTDGEPAFQGTPAYCTWKNYQEGTWAPARFYKDSTGVVHLSGLVDAEDVGEGCSFLADTDGLIFTLPPGYRPTHFILFPVVANNAIGRVTIRPDGGVWAEPGTEPNAKEFMGLDGITFRTGKDATVPVTAKLSKAGSRSR